MNLDYAAVTRCQQELWAAADFHQVGLRVMAASEALCDAAGVGANQSVLDVACGGGNAALVAARRYCEVTGIDFVPSLIERAQARARADGINATFVVGDAQALPFEDERFDVVLSVFGVMFAPDQERAGRELVRVCRRGGTVAIASWMPEDYGGELLGTYAKYARPAPELPSPLRWGTEAGVRELLGDGVTLASAGRRVLRQYYRSLDHAVSVFLEHFGPMRAAYEALGGAERRAFAGELRSLFERYNAALDGSVRLEGRYLEVVAQRRVP